MLNKVAVIVPLAPGDPSWTDLAGDLATLPAGAELIFTGPKPPLGELDLKARLSGRRYRLAWLRSPLGRARQMNLAARSTLKPFLWFVHADSRVSASAVQALGQVLQETPQALHYFDLAFDTTDFRRMVFNNAGVWFRSHGLGLPFGDQGFCMSRDTFFRLGGYDETAPYGEDHLLIWKARQAGVALRCTGKTLGTSPRKYRDKGWLKTTVRHQMLTVKQAWPEMIKAMIKAWQRRP